MHFRYRIALAMVLALLSLTLPALAQDTPVYAAVQGNDLKIFTTEGELVVTRPAGRVISTAWSPDGSKLAFIQYDETFTLHLLVADVADGAGVPLNTGALEAGYPVTFTPEGDILYVAQGVFPTDPSVPYTVEVKRIAPDPAAAPQTA